MTQTDMLAEPVRSQRLKAATYSAHDRLDQRIMAAQPFASRARYACFLQVQRRFHADIDGFYRDPLLAGVVPDLAGRRRLAAIQTDLADLGMASAAAEPPVAIELRGDLLATGLGWLYVAEGSNLGAAILFKLARALELDEDFGARHLAGHPDGRARHWRSFTGVLDQLALAPEREAIVIAAACDAFDRVRGYVEQYMPTSPHEP